MVALTRSLARQFRLFLGHCRQPGDAREPPLLRLHAGPHGLEWAVCLPDCTLAYQQADTFPAQTLIFRADLLADIESTDDATVTRDTVGDGTGEARWSDGGVPCVRRFNLETPEKMPALPELPAPFHPLDLLFLAALAEAARTIASEGGRFALTRIQIRGGLVDYLTACLAAAAEERVLPSLLTPAVDPHAA